MIILFVVGFCLPANCCHRNLQDFILLEVFLWLFCCSSVHHHHILTNSCSPSPLFCSQPLSFSVRSVPLFVCSAFSHLSLSLSFFYVLSLSSFRYTFPHCSSLHPYSNPFSSTLFLLLFLLLVLSFSSSTSYILSNSSSLQIRYFSLPFSLILNPILSLSLSSSWKGIQTPTSPRVLS